MTDQIVARSYGDLALRSSCGVYENIQDLQLSKYDYGYYCRRDRGELAHRFNEYNYNDTQKGYSFFINRTVIAWSGDCFIYSQVGNSTLTRDTTRDFEARNYTYTNGTFNGTISIPESSSSLSDTTYIHRGINRP